MRLALSMNLRTRVLAAVEARMSCRSAGAGFGVAPSTPLRWQVQRGTTGNMPKPQGRDTRSARVVKYREEILAIWEARQDTTLDEFRVPAGIGVDRRAKLTPLAR